MKKLVIEISNTSIVILGWIENSVESCFVYSQDDDEGQLLEILEILKGREVNLLLNVGDETFYSEEIPLLGRRDRERYIERLVAKKSRNHDAFRCSSIEVDRKEKKERIVLSTVLFTEFVKRWLGRLSELGILVNGLWSSVHLAPRSRAVLPKNDRKCLFVVLSGVSHVRTLLVEQESILLSFESRRKVGAKEAKLYTVEVADIVARFRRFCESKRLIEQSEVLPSYLIVSIDGESHKSRENLGDPELFNTYSSVIYEEAFQEMIHSDKASAIDPYRLYLAYLCSESQAGSSHYRLEVFHDAAQIRSRKRTLNRLVLALVPLLLFISTVLVTKANYRAASAEVVLEQRSKATQYYTDHFAFQERELFFADEMQFAVQAVEQLKPRSSLSMIDLFAPVGTLLSMRAFQEIHLAQFSYRIVEGEQVFESISNFNQKFNGTLDESYISSPETFLGIVEIKGEITKTVRSYVEVSGLLDRFIAALKDLPRVEYIWVAAVPIDKRPESTIKGVSGLEGSLGAATRGGNVFSLYLLVELLPNHTVMR